MREIKFRAWDKKGKIMVYSPCPDLVIFLDGMVCIGEPCEATDNFELMQFTGLHDKNDKEIYEGDIVNLSGSGTYSGKNMIVCYHKYHAGFALATKKENIGEWAIKMEGQHSGGSQPPYSPYEVIGNIYQNPELLSGGAK